MEEIKVGEYVRTINGKIGKVYSICEKIIDEAGTYYKYILDIKETLSIQDSEDIVKHSPNIIDLIEEGDYVNGYLVIAKSDDGYLEITVGDDIEQGELLEESDIKSVVTKEQFKSIEYNVV